MCRGIPFGWIGLYKYSESSTDPSPSAQYWLDGSTSTFRRWAVGNPDDTNTRCIGMWTALGAFDDRDCDDEYSVVCKKTGGVYVVNFSVLNVFTQVVTFLSFVSFLGSCTNKQSTPNV